MAGRRSAPKCTAKGCEHPRPRRRQFCAGCFTRLPDGLRARVSNAWALLHAAERTAVFVEARKWLAENGTRTDADRAAIAEKVQRGAWWHD